VNDTTGMIKNSLPDWLGHTIPTRQFFNHAKAERLNLGRGASKGWGSRAVETAAIASVHAEQLVMPRHRKGVNACDNYAKPTCVG